MGVWLDVRTGSAIPSRVPRQHSITAQAAPPDSVLSDRYEILGEIASGGMASVLYGRRKGPGGFARAVAIKRLHPHIAREPDFATMFVDEARICARLSHVNIVATLDVIEVPSELCMVMEYVHGAALDVLIDLTRERNEQVPIRIAVALLAGVLHGLHAAHETRDDHGEPLSVVHRDVSPQNVLVGEDGVARVLDFGIAKAAGKLRSTPSGEVKGKLAYMAPEQFRGGAIDRRVDIYGAAAVLWETLIGRPLFDGQNDSSVVYRVLNDEPVPPSRERDDVPAALDAIVQKGLEREPERRFATAREMALALERDIGGARQSEVSEWVRGLAGGWLDSRATDLRRLSQSGVSMRGADAQRELAGRSEGTRKVPPSSTPTSLVPSPPTQTKTHALRRRRLALVLAASCVVAAVVVYFLSGRPRDQTPTPAAVQRAVEAPRAVIRHAAEAARPEPAAESAPPATPSVESATLPGEGKLPEGRALPRAGFEARPRARERSSDELRAAPPKQLPDPSRCSPPYWLSADGVKHYKRECL